MSWMKQGLQAGSVRLGLLAAAGLVSVGAWMGSVDPVQADSHEHGEASLHETMETVNDGFRFIARNIKDPEQKQACLQHVEKMLQASVTGRMALPHVVEDAPAAEKEKLVAEYRSQMCDLIIGVAKLEKAIVTDDAAGAMALLKELNGIKKTGHEAFMD